MRFDVVAAILLGILLPTLETVRRGIGYWSVSFTTMFEDYLAGVALVVCALGALRGARWAPLALLIVWSGVASMMLLSTVSQVEEHFWGNDPEPRSGVVLCAKLLLLIVSVVALSQSVRRQTAQRSFN